jgi:hypothetical protein
MDALKGRIGGSGSGDVRTAIAGRCDVIITTNLAHFTEEAVGPSGIEVRDPDDFLLGQLELAPGVFCHTISRIRARLKSPPYTVEGRAISTARVRVAARNLEVGLMAVPLGGGLEVARSLLETVTRSPPWVGTSGWACTAGATWASNRRERARRPGCCTTGQTCEQRELAGSCRTPIRIVS